MASGFIDSLKLMLSDKYDISDTDYIVLSDILLSSGLSDSDKLSSILKGFVYMSEHKVRFPISIDALKKFWGVIS